jgi:hypothetical protein
MLSQEKEDEDPDLEDERIDKKE